jgi:hypothetical protein
MGCDIHCYLEYKTPSWNAWQSFGGRTRVDRNYQLFALLADVRNGGQVSPVADPRGFPEDAGYAATDDNWLLISDGDGDGCCSVKEAERYVTACGSRYRDSTKQRVSHPDWHSHSWLTTDEFAKAVILAGGPECRALLAAMRSFETEGMSSRLVFWFDN